MLGLHDGMPLAAVATNGTQPQALQQHTNHRQQPAPQATSSHLDLRYELLPEESSADKNSKTKLNSGMLKSF